MTRDLFSILVFVLVPALMARGLIGEEFGNRQLSQILDDRPEMRGAVKPKDPLYGWAATAFSASDNERIYWDNREPSSGRPTEYLPAYSFYPRLIRITKKPVCSGAQKWSFLVFELNNCGNHKEMNALARAAIGGEISRETFANNCVRHEFDAMVKTKLVLKLYPIPGSDFPRIPEKFSDYLKLLDLDSDGYDPRDYYKQYFDNAIKPYLQRAQLQGVQKVNSP